MSNAKLEQVGIKGKNITISITKKGVLKVNDTKLPGALTWIYDTLRTQLPILDEPTNKLGGLRRRKELAQGKTYRADSCTPHMYIGQAVVILTTEGCIHRGVLASIRDNQYTLHNNSTRITIAESSILSIETGTAEDKTDAHN